MEQSMFMGVPDAKITFGRKIKQKKQKHARSKNPRMLLE